MTQHLVRIGTICRFDAPRECQRVAIMFVAVTLLAMPTYHVEAVTITSVTAPDLTRPKDGITYPFNIDVAGTYNGVEAAAGGGLVLDANYYDNDLWPNPDDAIHLKPGGMTTSAVPLGSAAGTPWTATVEFLVGCTVGGIVFGPSGNTGEGPVMDDGYFNFPDVGFFGSSWGYNTVTCVSVGAGSTMPNNMQPVPEPSIGLLLAAISSMTLGRLRRIGSVSN